MTPFIHTSTLTLLIFVLHSSQHLQEPRSSALTLTPETVAVEDGTQVVVDAGRLEVPESRTGLSQRSISIPFYRIPSNANKPGPAIFILTGGPGASGLEKFTNLEPFQAVTFFREIGDVVVFDQRGAGSANPNLTQDTRFPGIPLDQPATAEAVADMMAQMGGACRNYWEAQGVPLAAYNTDENAADVEALRGALGYDRIILVGGSYGSHLGLHYLRKYPHRAARALFYGIEGPDHTFDLPSQVLAAYQRIAAHVEQSGKYRDRLPEGGLFAAWKIAIHRVQQQPIKVTIPKDGNPVEVWITPFLVQMAGSRAAGSQKHPERWPETILAMYEGNYSLAAQVGYSLQTSRAPHAMKYAMDLASSMSATRRNALENDPASNVLGFLNLDLLASERAWRIQPLGNGFNDPIRAETPVLLIHGTWDTSTPVENAREVAASLANSHLLEVVGGNHGALYNLLAHWKPAKATLKNFLLGAPQSLPAQVVLERPGTAEQKRLIQNP